MRLFRLPSLIQTTTRLRALYQLPQSQSLHSVSAVASSATTTTAKSLSTFVSPTRPTTQQQHPKYILRALPTIPFFGQFSSSSSSSNSISEADKMPENFPVQKSDDEWRTVLNKEQFRILREKGTERAGTGEYEHHTAPGVYTCAACDAPLYKDAHKFDSHCGWPAFFDAIPGAVKRNVDKSWGMERTEIVCANCGGHLGHVFKGEGYNNPIDERHCVNSVSMSFHGKDGEAEPKV